MPDFCPPLNPQVPLHSIAQELVDVFAEAGFNTHGIAAHLGPQATEALYRGEPAAVEVATSADTQMDLLIRLFLLHQPAPATDLAAAVGSVLATKLVDANIALADPNGVIRIALDIRSHIIDGTNRWVFSDVDASVVEHVPGPDHVLGVGAASLSLLRTTPTTPVHSVLDLGTGSGVQLLGQLGSAENIVATDVHERALALAQATIATTGAKNVDFRHGSWFEPVAGEHFDRIVANPPFVVGLPEVGHVYRDSGLNLDGASELVISEAAEHLNPGGTAHLLAAWVHTSDGAWQQRVASWIPKTGVSAWVLQRDVADPALYVSTWLKDESIDPRSDEGRERARLWLEHFRDNDVTGIGFGFVALQRIDDSLTSEVTAEEISQAFDDALGPEIEEHFMRSAWLRNLLPDEIGDKQFGLRPGVAREDIALATAEVGFGFSRATMRLTRTEGPRWTHEVDEHVASIVAGLNPQGLNLRETIELYAVANDYDSEELLTAALPAITDLVRHGFLYPTELGPVL
ncbi:MAG: class I SAM-dependent methyltransferase [Corynebacterium casei]|uniref:class I SAM-dependent methyltransferase n=1 Tax=Corynebacterium casei TaxID=160386 RepID=UPI002648BDE2|nr:class I SAM-dependent methyltransferase [Corynebacterium casei]MDN6273922.1 class I SAM-dependent methyltransferase [Corynebacterium casei]